MPLNIEQKKEVVKELNIFASESVSGAIAEYSGLSVQDLSVLRNKARESGVYLKVVKNTLSKRAFEETDFKCLVDDLNGPIIIALSKEDLVAYLVNKGMDGDMATVNDCTNKVARAKAKAMMVKIKRGTVERPPMPEIK